MRRGLLFLIALALSLQSSAGAQSGGRETRPAAPDGVTQLLADIQAAMISGRAQDLQALTAGLPEAGQAIIAKVLATGAITSAAVKERARRPLDQGNQVEVLAEVFVSHGRNARLCTWLMTAEPRAGAPQRYALAALAEPASFDGLVKLSLTPDKQFTVRNLTITAPDVTLTMASGSAFVAEDDGGATAMVLRGRGTLTFTPPDPAEQGEIEDLSGRRSFDAVVDSAFIRIDSGEFAERVAAATLTPVRVVPDEFARAREVFDDLSRKTYNVSLRDLTPDQWSFSPVAGSILIEFHSGRYGWLTYARSPNDAEDVALFDRLKGRNISLYTSAEKLTARGPSYSEDDMVPYDVERYAVDLAIDPRGRTLSGRTTLSLRVKTAIASVITLKLAEALTVTSISSPEFGRLLGMRVVGQNTLMINLPHSILRGSDLVLDIAYNGRVNPQTLDSESPAGQAPIAAGEPNPSNTPDLLKVLPEARFLYSNQVAWYPQSQVTDYATGTLRLQVPAEYQVLANGARVRSAVTPGSGAEAPSTRTVEYVIDRPVRYLSCLVTRLVEIGRANAAVPAIARPAIELGEAALPPAASVGIDVMSTPRTANANRLLPARVADIVHTYATLVGEAPYPTLTVATVDDNLPGGHSPAFFAIWLQPLASTPYSWVNDPLSMDSAYPQFFLAHEVAHQWWGQAVGWKNYHEQWLSEGLAQYFAAIYAGTERGPDMLRGLLAQMRDSAMTYTARGPVALGYRIGHVSGDSRVLRAVLYNKSAVVLHMLRRLIGEEAFFAGVRRYYRDWRYAKSGTDELRAAFEAETPMRLGRFFDRWIRGTAVPRLQVTSRVDPSGATAVVRIEQIGDVFDLPFTVTIQYADGTSQAVTIPVTEAITERPISLKGAVRRIVLRDDLTLADYGK